MSARITTPAAGRRSARIAAVLCGCLAAGVTAVAMAQQVTNPGDIIVERDVTPRGAFDSVPRSQDPVLVRATTFPANTFNPTMAAVVSDAELTSAHGSTGVVASNTAGATAASMQVLTGVLSGRESGNNMAMGAGVQAGGMGGSITSAVTGALAPISAALGAVK
ncbi:hypothetical protein [Paraburkholderia acidipaludis]|uniref:hypothetical protein n=1 Tax=Paraburkholderia acidipaludis TaxID=660537 RepID=UPI0005B8AC95|nr:hypothetical protein [Paraburkholderia acidipaludis]